ncbi:hypothetical protein [Nocardioides sp. SR21]|uniref:hypothetical protein n=1 Tax=Nocardioides sp. SR21 TaxID=2919501 RepID=UPI001FAAE89F|nr:hypothetical protein [Nocardioides sp. SR21]
MWREIAGVGLSFGVLWLGATFAIPAAFAGGAITFWGKAGYEGLAVLLGIGCFISLVVLVPPYVQTVDRCKQLEIYQTPSLAEQITGEEVVTAEDLEYVQKGCADLPFT